MIRILATALLALSLTASLLLPSHVLAQSKFRTFQCEEPMPAFTLAEDSDPTSAQLKMLCTCIWNSFPEESSERKTSRKVSRTTDTVGAKELILFSARFGAAIRQCGGYDLSPSAAKPDSEMLLSRADADRMFSFSLNQWNQNVRLAVEAGMSQMIGNPKTGLTQMMSTPKGGLMVYPHYETSKQTPDYILVSVIYDQPIAKIFTEERVSELLGQATAELGGKYIVDNFAKSEGDAIVIHWVIRQANTPMD